MYANKAVSRAATPGLARLVAESVSMGLIANAPAAD